MPWLENAKAMGSKLQDVDYPASTIKAFTQNTYEQFQWI